MTTKPKPVPFTRRKAKAQMVSAKELRRLRGNSFVTATTDGPQPEWWLLQALDYFTAQASTPHQAVKLGTLMYAEINRLKKKCGEGPVVADRNVPRWCIISLPERKPHRIPPSPAAGRKGLRS